MGREGSKKNLKADDRPHLLFFCFCKGEEDAVGKILFTWLGFLLFHFWNGIFRFILLDAVDLSTFVLLSLLYALFCFVIARHFWFTLRESYSSPLLLFHFVFLFAWRTGFWVAKCSLSRLLFLVVVFWLIRLLVVSLGMYLLIGLKFVFQLRNWESLLVYWLINFIF